MSQITRLQLESTTKWKLHGIICFCGRGRSSFRPPSCACVQHLRHLGILETVAGAGSSRPVGRAGGSWSAAAYGLPGELRQRKPCCGVWRLFLRTAPPAGL